MSRFFWLLLTAARGGYKYLRSILAFGMDLRSRAQMAPGTDAAAELAQDTQLRAVPEFRTAHDMILMGRAGEVGLSADLVCWIVNDVVSRWMAELVLEAAPVTGTGTPGVAALPHRMPLSAAADTAPPTAAALRRGDEVALAASAGTALPVCAAGGFTLRMELEAPAVSTPAVPAAGTMTAALQRVSARAGSGLPDPTAARTSSGPELTAKMMCWTAPEWVAGNTLYIRQVYSATQDGDALILH